MSTIELELQKANLAREILTTNDENFINNILIFIKNNYVFPVKKKKKKREIGFLKGKAEVVFHKDWSMTPEELEMV
jgi:hypothetical protein